jgi:hypothetical protein
VNKTQNSFLKYLPSLTQTINSQKNRIIILLMSIRL